MAGIILQLSLPTGRRAPAVPISTRDLQMPHGTKDLETINTVGYIPLSPSVLITAGNQQPNQPNPQVNPAPVLGHQSQAQGKGGRCQLPSDEPVLLTCFAWAPQPS